MAERIKAPILRVTRSGAYRFESCPLPLGVERLGSFRHPSPVVGPSFHRLGISQSYGGLCGMHRRPPLGYIPNELLKKKKKKKQLGASITGILCALTLRSMFHVASPAPRQKILLPRLPFRSIRFQQDPLTLLVLTSCNSQGSGYILVCVDHFNRFVVLAPLRDKSAATVADAL